MESSKPKTVVIVGGSLAGLMHALALLSQLDPPTVRILERSPTALLHNQGAGIVAGNEVQEFFDKIVKPGREIGVASNQRLYFKNSGEVIEDSVETRQERMTSWDLLYHLLRWRVEGLQSNYVEGLEADNRPKASYQNGCTVTALEESGEKMKLSWTHKDLGEQSCEADLIIAADGASSTIRRFLMPDIHRKYVGYVAWRGTVPETQLSDEARKVFTEKFAFYHSDGIQILEYLIPGKNGTIEPGHRLFNWVWYCNYKDGSDSFEELMTDINGKRHAITLPVGTMNPDAWLKQKAYASKTLPPQYAEAVCKTEQPFIQAITDVISPQNSFFDGKVLLVGDALAGFRPHTAASTSQAAFDALRMGDWFGGEIDKTTYDTRVLEFAKRVQERGVMLGERSQFGRHPFAG
jgi:2-polyprenyl-6-methoxyphenol hydroxylase-like FAD-dependent oxidoreductase